MSKNPKMQLKNSIYWILPKNSSKIQDFAKKGISWILNSIALNLFFTGSFIWGISLHNLKYLDTPIKCLEMSVKIKSVRKIEEILLCTFFPQIPQFWQKVISLWNTLYMRCLRSRRNLWTCIVFVVEWQIQCKNKIWGIWDVCS